MKLEEAIAEIKFKDMATKDLLAFQKKVNAAVRDLTKLEKETAKAETLLGKLGKSAKESGKAVGSATKETAEKPIGLAEKTISSGLVGAVAAVPIVGGLLSAIMGATGDVKEKFIAGLGLKKELLNYSADIQKSFGKNTKQVLSGFDSSFSTLTQQQKTMSEFARRGVSAETMMMPGFKENMTNLAKAMGVEVDQVTSLMDSTSGLDAVTQMRAKTYMALMASGNPIAADIATKQYADLLNENSDVIKVEAEKRMKTADAYGTSIKDIQSASVEAKTREQSNKLILTEEGRYYHSLQSLSNAFENEAIAIKTKGFGARGETLIKDAAKNVFGSEATKKGAEGQMSTGKKLHENEPGYKYSNKTDSWIPKARGGNVQAGQKYLVGEEGPEHFTPSQSGRITPNNQISGKSGSVSYSPTINIYGISAQDIGNQINEAMDNAARELSYILGMPVAN